MKKWFIYAIHNIFNYQGRARRAEFVGFQFINYLSQMAIYLSVIDCALCDFCLCNIWYFILQRRKNWRKPIW